MKTTFKHTSLIAAALLICASSSAMAQSKKAENFTGLGVGVALSSVRNSMEVTSGVSDLAGNSTEAAITGSYGFAMSKDWVGTLGVSVGLKNSDYGTYTSAGVTSAATAKNHLSFSFAPGFRVGEQGLLYAKIALHQMTVNYTSTSGFDLTKTHQGTGLGVGYAMAVAPAVELNVEYETIGFDTQNTTATATAKPKQDNLTFGVTFRF